MLFRSEIKAIIITKSMLVSVIRISSKHNLEHIEAMPIAIAKAMTSLNQTLPDLSSSFVIFANRSPKGNAAIITSTSRIY